MSVAARSFRTSTPPTTRCTATRRGVTATLAATFRSTGTTLGSRLRPANVDPAAGAVEELARERWPETIVRGDGGRDGTWCEDNGVDDLLSRNARLTERRQLRKSRRRCVSTGEARFCDFRCRTRTSWSRTRRAVAKAEWLPGPRGARFAVTSPGCKRARARILYEKPYCARGENAQILAERAKALGTVLRARGERILTSCGPPCGRNRTARTGRTAERQPVRRPDRDHAGEPVAPRLRDVRQPRRRGSAWPAPVVQKTASATRTWPPDSMRADLGCPLLVGFALRHKPPGRGRPSR